MVSMIWMLLLAITLVFVDYFMSPVVTSSTKWKFTKIDEFARVLVNKPQCIQRLDKYKQKNQQQKKYRPTACLLDGSLVLIEDSNYKGVLTLLKDENYEKIATNLQQPHIQFIGLNNEIYILEKGRNRVLKFSRLKSK